MKNTLRLRVFFMCSESSFLNSIFQEDKSMPTPLPRSKVKQYQTWNAESVFASAEQFDAELKSILESLPAIKQFQGRLGESIETFLTAMQASGCSRTTLRKSPRVCHHVQRGRCQR
jgi:hypothetical protein